MKPYIHSLNSANKWGGTPDQYQAIHDFLDSSKSTFADMRHRAILHSSFGCYLAERVFGINIKVDLDNGLTKLVSVRDVAEAHIIEDMGRIPSPGDYLSGMPFYDWLGGTKKEKKVTKITGAAILLEEFNKQLSELDVQQSPKQSPFDMRIID